MNCAPRIARDQPPRLLRVARPNQFLHLYMSKDYSVYSTDTKSTSELLSMVMENLSAHRVTTTLSAVMTARHVATSVPAFARAFSCAG